MQALCNPRDLGSFSHRAYRKHKGASYPPIPSGDPASRRCLEALCNRGWCRLLSRRQSFEFHLEKVDRSEVSSGVRDVRGSTSRSAYVYVGAPVLSACLHSHSDTLGSDGRVLQKKGFLVHSSTHRSTSDRTVVLLKIRPTMRCVRQS